VRLGPDTVTLPDRLTDPVLMDGDQRGTGVDVAADDLPLPVVNFLNVIGVPWPYIDEDVVSEFASLTRAFATAVETTHQDARRAVEGIAAAHQASSTDAMASGWSAMSSRHVYQLIDAAHVLADALDAAAAYIVGQKVVAAGVLVGMAAAFVADQAAAVATAGVAEAAVPVIIAGARVVVKSLVMDLEQYLIARVVEAAAKPLFAQVEAAMSGLDWSGSGLGGSASGGRDGFSVDPGAVGEHIAILRSHAATMRQHGLRYEQAVSGLSF
jgi:hypothetical protein